MFVRQNSPGVRGSPLTSTADPPSTSERYRLNHLKRHLLTRKPQHSFTCTVNPINPLWPDTDSRRHECEVSKHGQLQFCRWLLLIFSRDVIFNLPEETSSQNTYEYAENRTWGRPLFPRTNTHPKHQTVRLDLPNLGENLVRLVPSPNANATYNNPVPVASPRKGNAFSPTPRLSLQSD